MSKDYLITRPEAFDQLVWQIARDLLTMPPVKTATWQSQDISDRPEMTSYEIMHARVEMPIPLLMEDLQRMVLPNLPWAEDHFRERVGGEPLNPPPSEAWWPFAQQGNAAHKANEKFSHTYPERFWPRFALGEFAQDSRCSEGHPISSSLTLENWGVRYRYGDLQDLVNLLKRDLSTRQAYLPVWFPEDTGAVSGQRVPCTLGYHFLCRNDQLHVEYHIRSCDFMRHWRDDVYMAGRLTQWICDHIGVAPGRLVMNIGSFHIFEGDIAPLKAANEERRRRLDRDWTTRMAQFL